MSRETLKSFLNQRNHASDKISYKVDPATGDPNDIDVLIEIGSSDIGIDPNTQEKLIDFNENKGMLGDYVSFVTKDNKYNINQGTKAGYINKKGDSLSDNHDANVYITSNSELGQKLSDYSNSKNISNLNDIVNKTEANNHNLLKDIPGTRLNETNETSVNSDIDNQVVNAVSSILNKNRFANISKKTPFAPKITEESDFESNSIKGTYTIQNKFGKFDNINLQYNLDEAKKVSQSMLYKASGYDTGANPGESLEIEELEEKIKSGDLKPADLSDGYIMKDFENLRPRNTKNAPQEDGKPYKQDDDLIDMERGINSNSYGNTFNPSMKLDDHNDTAIKIKAIIAIKAAVESIKRVSETITNSIETHVPDTIEAGYASYIKGNETTGPYFFGKSRGVANSYYDVFCKMLIPKTDFKYSDCVEAGLLLIYGGDNINPEMTDSFSIIFDQGPGYVLNLFMSFLKKLKIATETISSGNNLARDEIYHTIKMLNKEKLLGVTNSLAIMGNSALRASGGNKRLSGNYSGRNIDKLPDTPGNRISKSTERDGMNNLKRAWAQNSTPSAYLLPTNIIRAGVKLEEGRYSPNPVRGMLGSELVDNTYMDYNNDGPFGRIPEKVVKELEDRLDAEYVPFYIQDLRTNEIISFHAFLDSLSDTYNVSNNATPGYGRLDPIQNYGGTTRTVNVGFTLLASNKEDFDSMWYKINKLTTLNYPQWSRGTKVSNGKGSTFIQPFSQVIGATPLVRLRVGDVIKSNYSKFSLGRIFGIGEPGIKAKPETSSVASTYVDAFAQSVTGGISYDEILEGVLKGLVLVFGSPMQLIAGGEDLLKSAFKDAGDIISGGADIASDVISSVLKNGFVNPLTSKMILSLIKSPDVFLSENKNFFDVVGGITGNSENLRGAGLGDEGNLLSPFSPVELKANNNIGYTTENGRKIYFAKNVFVRIKSFEIVNGKAIYKVEVKDGTSEYTNTVLFCQHTDFIFSPSFIFDSSGLGALFGAAGGVASFGNAVTDFAREGLNQNGFLGTNSIDNLAKSAFARDEVLFMNPEVNPYTKAYQSTAGRGLAGILGGMTFNWLDFNWETDWGARAPMGAKITLALQVIHDIPPGLDSSGYNRAPIYNVGGIMNDIAGDVYDDGGSGSKNRYKLTRTDTRTGGDD